MTERRAIVIIGGGAIGLSVAYHLSRLGIEDVLVLERHRLTSGTSWHAAGIVGPLRASLNLTRLAQYALDLFVELESETGQTTGYRQTGGAWLAQRPERLAELKRIKALGDRAGLATELVDAAELGARCPHLAVDDLAGGLWVEADAQVNPVDLCQAYARGARARGVEIREHCRVDAIETRDGNVASVRLADGGRIECGKLLLAAGAWSRELGRSAGLVLPLAACEHVYLVTEPLAGLPEPCPILRDLDAGIYLKGDAGKLVLGAFEADPKPWQPALDDDEFLQFDADWEHAQPMLEAGICRVPQLAEQGIAHFMNGPESFTPDTKQVMGLAPGFANLFVAAGFNSIGIMSSAGVGKVMADWIRDGEPPMDLWEVDIARFDPLQGDAAYLAARLPEAVHNQFAMHWPFKQYRTGRGLRRSPWHERLAECGAVFGAPTGWERPLWYARDDSEREFEYGYGAQCWWPAARREALHCQQHVSLFELSPFAKFDLRGRDALALLQRLCCGDIDVDVGRVKYTLMLNRRGGIEAEVTVARLGPRHFRVVGGAATRFKDLAWLRRHAGDAVEIADVSDAHAVLGVMGPLAGMLMEALADGFDAGAFPFSSAREIAIDGVAVLAARLSYVGEPGWELYIPGSVAIDVLERVLAVGADFELGLAGHFALDSCRIEVGYRHWGHDIGPDDTPLECGLDFAVDFDKAAEFIGHDALLAQASDGVRKRLRLCEVGAGDVLIVHDEPVYAGDQIIGHCTSGGPGFRSAKTLCFVMIYDTDTIAGRDLEIEVAGVRYPLQPLARPPCEARR